MASAAAPGVSPPTGTPATDVPGAIRTSDEATSPITATPAGMPIHSASRRLRGAGSSGAHTYVGVFPSPAPTVVLSASAASDGSGAVASPSGASSAPGLVAKSVMPTPPGCEHVPQSYGTRGKGRATDASQIPHTAGRGLMDAHRPVLSAKCNGFVNTPCKLV